MNVLALRLSFLHAAPVSPLSLPPSSTLHQSTPYPLPPLLIPRLVHLTPCSETSGQTRRGGGCAATVKLYATGFLPTSIPLAPVLNVLFFWFPFASPSPRGGMLQNSRSQELYEMLRAKLPKAGQSVK